jgi:thiamine-monophosphate kinase
MDEEEFIRQLGLQFPSEGEVVGIGDDCAVIPAGPGTSWLITTDALVEGVHFLKDQIPPKDLGYKTIAVNVSDIAAKGGVPKYAFLSIAVPKSIEMAWMHDYMEGIKETCMKWDIHLLGGDTVGSKRDIFINLTLVGTAPTQHIKYRDQAETGDLICVTKYLGDSGGGLKALLSNISDAPALVNEHFCPVVRPEFGPWLSSQSGVHAMMDVSDGLNCDLMRLLRKSKKSAVIDTEHVPLSKELKEACKQNGWDPLTLALTGGEDYCLLFTVCPTDFDRIQNAFQKTFGMPLFTVGCIENPPERVIYRHQGTQVETDFSNFNHFQ